MSNRKGTGDRSCYSALASGFEEVYRFGGTFLKRRVKRAMRIYNPFWACRKYAARLSSSTSRLISLTLGSGCMIMACLPSFQAVFIQNKEFSPAHKAALTKNVLSEFASCTNINFWKHTFQIIGFRKLYFREFRKDLYFSGNFNFSGATKNISML